MIDKRDKLLIDFRDAYLAFVADNSEENRQRLLLAQDNLEIELKAEK